MEIRIELNGKKRKALAAAVGELVETPPVYQQAPSYAYDIGEVILTRDSTLVFPADMKPESIRQLLDDLQAKGFSVEESRKESQEEPEEKPQEDLQEASQEEPRAEPQKQDKLVIQMPLDSFDAVSLDNLLKIVASKATLIQKALGVDNLPVEQTEDAVSFPWFAVETPAEDVIAYTEFISALCDMAKKQKRVLAIEHPIENDKYAFRCFLLRLGFIGERYANTRRILLRNLSGNGSFKNGERKQAKPPKPPETAEHGQEPTQTAESVPKKDEAEVSAKMSTHDEQVTTEEPAPSSTTGGKIKSFLNGLIQSFRVNL